MKQTSIIEEIQKLKKDNEYLKEKFSEAKEIIREKDRIIEELKKNLDSF
jgi:hypothetical protein